VRRNEKRRSRHFYDLWRPGADAISVNKMCRTPLESATDMQKHIAVHDTSRAFAAVGHVM
jgi:hypothetical protein